MGAQRAEFGLDELSVMGRLAPTWAAEIAGMPSIALSAVSCAPAADSRGRGWPRVRGCWACARWLPTGVSGVVGCDEGSFAGAGYEGPVQAGFQVVVEPAQRVQLVEAGVLGVGPGFLVVVFDPPPVAALDRAPGVGPQQGDLLRGGRPAAQVGDVGHVDPVGDDQFDDGFAE